MQHSGLCERPASRVDFVGSFVQSRPTRWLQRRLSAPGRTHRNRSSSCRGLTAWPISGTHLASHRRPIPVSYLFGRILRHCDRYCVSWALAWLLSRVAVSMHALTKAAASECDVKWRAPLGGKKHAIITPSCLVALGFLVFSSPMLISHHAQSRHDRRRFGLCTQICVVSGVLAARLNASSRHALAR